MRLADEPRRSCLLARENRKGTRRNGFPQISAYGGGVCESNTPGTLFTPHYGFEDRGAHQDPSASKGAFSGRSEGVSNSAWAGGPLAPVPNLFASCPAGTGFATCVHSTARLRPARLPLRD